MENLYIETINKKRQKEILNIKKCNEYTNKYGLTLSDKQISNILERKKDVLKDTGRIELREGIIDKIIKKICDSPYITKENYETILNELIEIFYRYKNETMDLISDDELIEFMKKSFNGIAQGDLEYLYGTIMYQMRENLIKGKSLDHSEKEIEDYE